MAEKPPKASPPAARTACWRASNSDLRVTGSCASAAREVMAAASTPASSAAKAVVRCWASAICRGSAAIRAASRTCGSRASRLS
jgi:hypothetical protein